MKPMTITQITDANHRPKRGFVGPLYWEYRRGFAGHPITLFQVTQLLSSPPAHNSRAKFCGPVYMKRPEE